jgi:hypothetical protein
MPIPTVEINRLEVVALNGVSSWNRLCDWLHQLDRLRNFVDA